MASIEEMQEAVRRGIELPPDKQELYDEAVKRGMIEDARPGMMDQAIGIGRAGLEGVKRGGVGLLNMGSDLAAMARDKAGGMMGIAPETMQAMQQAQSGLGIGVPSRTEAVKGRADQLLPNYEPRNRRERYAMAIGEQTPGLMMGPNNLAMRGAAAVGSGVGSEAAGEATKGSWLEPFARFGGAVLGGSLPDIVRRGITPFPINQSRQANIDVLNREGIPTSAGQRTGSKTLGYMETELGGGATARLAEQQDEALTAAAGRPAGINANRLDPAAFRQAYDNVDTTFTGLANRTVVPLDQPLQNDLLTAVTRYEAVTGNPATGANDVMNRIAKLSGQNGGALPGPSYQAIITEMRQMSEASSDPALIRTLREMRNALDDSIERGLPGNLVGDWRQARRQYANLMTLQDAMTGAGGKTSEGLVTPNKLRQAVDGNTTDRNYLSGNGDLAPLARASSNVMNPLADSGTAGRTRAQNVGVGVSSAVGAGLGYGSGAGPLGILGGMALGAATPLAMGRALMSRPMQEYLANQIANGRGMTAGGQMGRAALGTAPRIRELIVKLLEEGKQ